MRLSVQKASKEAGVHRTVINRAMDSYKRMRGRKGLRFAEEKTTVLSDGNTRRNRWTTKRWIEEWEDRCSEQTVPQTSADPLQKDSRGLYVGRTKDILKAQGHA